MCLEAPGDELFLIAFANMYFLDLDQCTWAQRAPDWTPEKVDVRVKRGTYIITNNPALKAL